MMMIYYACNYLSWLVLLSPLMQSMKTNRNGEALTVLFCSVRCVVEDKNSKVAWLNRSGIIFAGHDKWSLDPRVELEKRHSLEYSLRIQKVDVYDEGSYTCSVQTQHEPKTSQVYLIVQGKGKVEQESEPWRVAVKSKTFDFPPRWLIWKERTKRTHVLITGGVSPISFA